MASGSVEDIDEVLGNGVSVDDKDGIVDLSTDVYVDGPRISVVIVDNFVESDGFKIEDPG